MRRRPALETLARALKFDRFSGTVKKEKRKARVGSRIHGGPRKSGAWKLLVIDEGPIRKRALGAYFKCEKRIAALRADIEAFETHDMPAFHRWEARTFGALLTEIREIETAIAEKKRILDAVDEERLWTGCSRAMAYHRVMKALNQPEGRNGENPEDEADNPFDDPEAGNAGRNESSGMFGGSHLPPGFDIDDYERMPAMAKAAFREFYEAVSELFEMTTGEPAPDLDTAFKRERARVEGNRRDHPPQERGSEAPPSAGDRVKAIYRRLVRQLHPDGKQNHGPRERELWHEMQEAYKERDLERLEAVSARIDISNNGASISLPVSIILRMTRHVRIAINGLTRQISQWKTHPAWEFGKRAGTLSRFESEWRSRLTRKMERAKLVLEQVRMDLDSLAAQASRPVRRRKRGRERAHAAQMSFFA